MKSSKKEKSGSGKKSKKKDAEPVSDGKAASEVADNEDSNSLTTVTTVESTKSVIKRSVTTMNEVNLKITRGKRIIKVSCTTHGTPNGPTRKRLQSYIGTLARTMVPINVSSWPDVDKDLKEQIWKDIEGAFKLPPGSKRVVLASAGTKWRQFKTMLTRKYVLPNLGRKRKLREPPIQYNFVGLDPWKKFVRQRKKPTWPMLHNEQSERVGKRKYPHRLSRLGYVGLEEKLMDKLPEGEEIDRALFWKKAREKKNGEIDEDAALVITEIDALLEKKKNGELKTSGSDDVLLTKVLKTPEHSSRVKGVGGYVNSATYFNIPRVKPDRVSRATLLARDLERDRELEETKKKLQDEAAKQLDFLFQKLAALEALVNENTPANGAAKTTDIDERQNLASPISDQASCQHTKYGNPEAKRVLGDDNVSDDEVQDVTGIKINGTSCELAVGSTTNIVAFGTIFEDNSANKTIHGIAMREDCIRVAVDGGLQDDAELPCPVKDKLETVRQAIGSHVAWPRNLVIPKGQKLLKKTKGAGAAASKKELKFNEEVNLDHPMVPKRCKLLYKHAKKYMNKTGQSIRTLIDANVFGYPREFFILDENVIDLLEMKWIGAGVIAAYMTHLHEELGAKNLLDTFGFIDPSFAYKRPSEEVEKFIVDRMKEGKSDRIFLMPHNTGKHWILTIIWEDEIYLMDSMAKPVHYTMWEETVLSAVKTFHTETGGVKKVPKWKQLPGAPKQPGGHECGYYVMRYMKEIIEDETLSFPKKWALKGCKEYTQDELDEVRIEVSDYLGTIIE